DALGYTLSLPERMVRSLAAALGGTTKLLTDTVIPGPLRESKTYTVLIGNAQRFVIEQVAQVQGVYAEDQGPALPENYVARKIAGNVMEAAGMFSVHLSPLWVFAIATDVAQGSKLYLNRLVDELREKKVIAPDTNIKELDELLEAIGRAGEESAKVFDAPPTNLDQIKELREQITAGYKSVFQEAGDLVPRVDDLWAKMEALAKRDGVAVESIVGLMTTDLNQAAGRALGAAFAVGNVTTDLLGDMVFKSYGETIQRIQIRGAVACIDEATRPFVEAIAANMTAGNQTLTQRAWRRLLGVFTGGRAAEEAVGQPGGPPEAHTGEESNTSSGANGPVCRPTPSDGPFPAATEAAPEPGAAPRSDAAAPPSDDLSAS
ncbi:MAG: hypothetical protein V3S01_06050, partial [Dehalococcoidia bacterium]